MNTQPPGYFKEPGNLWILIAGLAGLFSAMICLEGLFKGDLDHFITPLVSGTLICALLYSLGKTMNRLEQLDNEIF